MERKWHLCQCDSRSEMQKWDTKILQNNWCNKPLLFHPFTFSHTCLIPCKVSSCPQDEFQLLFLSQQFTWYSSFCFETSSSDSTVTASNTLDLETGLNFLSLLKPGPILLYCNLVSDYILNPLQWLLKDLLVDTESFRNLLLWS